MCDLNGMLDGNIPKTLQDLRDAEDDVLLKLYDKAQGNTKEFTKQCNMDFSYSSLTREIKNRGYEQRWVKDQADLQKSDVKDPVSDIETVEVNVREERCRKNIPMSKSCYDEFNKFLGGGSNTYLYVTAALRLFMKLFIENRLHIEITN